MSVLDESYIENKVVEWADDHDFLTPKVKFAERGWPDRLFISPFGHTIFIEFKRLGGLPDPLQWYRLMELKKRGIPAYCVDTILEGITILKAALEPARLPETSGEVTPITGVRGSLSGPRSGENEHLPSSGEHPEAAGYVSQDPDHSPAALHIQGVAGRDEKVAGVSQSFVDRVTRSEEDDCPVNIGGRHPPNQS